MPAADKEKRPHRTSMEGMIWNANHVLESALKPGVRGIPKELFECCAGLCIMSTASAGLIFSGTVGTGIFIARYKDDTWSNPVACGLTGVGFGFVAGIEANDLIIFLPDANAVRTFFSTGVKLSGKVDLTVLFGRTVESAAQASGSGFTDILTIGFTKGFWAGINLEGAVVSPRDKVNKHFYGEKVDPQDIIETDKIDFPDAKVTLWPDVQEKLKKLSQGVQEEPKPGDEEKKEAAKAAANSAAESFHGTEEEQIVDAEQAAVEEAVAGEAAAEPPKEASEVPAETTTTETAEPAKEEAEPSEPAATTTTNALKEQAPDAPKEEEISKIADAATPL